MTSCSFSISSLSLLHAKVFLSRAGPKRIPTSMVYSCKRALHKPDGIISWTHAGTTTSQTSRALPLPNKPKASGFLNHDPTDIQDGLRAGTQKADQINVNVLTVGMQGSCKAVLESPRSMLRVTGDYLLAQPCIRNPSCCSASSFSLFLLNFLSWMGPGKWPRNRS